MSRLLRRWVPNWLHWPQLDLPLLAALGLLIAFGLFVLYSASGGSLDTVYRQGARIGVGLVALLVLSQVPPHVLRIWTPWLYALGVLLLLATWLVGTGRSTSRWLDLGVFRFQPSEIMKLAVPMMLAAYLHPRRLPPDVRSLLVSVGILAVPAVLIARQPDLGTALLVAASGAFVLFLSGLQWRVIFGLVGLAAAAAPALWWVMHDYQRQRVLTFLDPESDPLGSGGNNSADCTSTQLVALTTGKSELARGTPIIGPPITTPVTPSRSSACAIAAVRAMARVHRPISISFFMADLLYHHNMSSKPGKCGSGRKKEYLAPCHPGPDSPPGKCHGRGNSGYGFNGRKP